MQQHGWSGLRSWLRISESDWFHDEAMMGTLPRYEAEELLADFGIEVTLANLKQLGREIEEALTTPKGPA